MEEAAAAELVDEAVVEEGDIEDAEVEDAEVDAGVWVTTADWMAVTADPAILMNWFKGLTLDD